MSLTTILIVIILLTVSLLIWTIKRIQLQNDALLQSERDANQIKTTMLEREASFQKQLDNDVNQIKTTMLERETAFQKQLDNDVNQIKTTMLERETAFQKQLDNDVKEARKRSNNTQRSVLKGQIGEQFTPFITDFPYNPSDCRFMGEPIDYVIFQNLHECADGNVPIEEVQIIIAEVKTGNSRLNQRQKIIKQAIQNGQVSFKELRIKQCEDTEESYIEVNA